MAEQPTATIAPEGVPTSAPRTGDAAGTYEPWRIVLGELDERMGVRVLEQSVERVVATMPVAGNRQSLGLLHGGAMLALGEAVGSWAALIHASTRGMVCVGVDANATHHRSVREGMVTAVATPIRLGGTITSHEVVISDEDGNRLSTFRITNLLRPAK
ncbi:uncharacterized domain 1-containing protein [Raineyella antarctica]|uniref:Uncharacterized domain 1-containing protein n=1 Tax=Raineyella antarctica TaxID=1577474 RepID=A0A1G6GFB7_9ACTN|nr:PaaI family thioesterase [Raineyella antarctica]SDB80654.1 uncharacterized domain 1-containing protein [Raineyella antarctica]